MTDVMPEPQPVNLDDPAGDEIGAPRTLWTWSMNS
jgi:hypothetical protein